MVSAGIVTVYLTALSSGASGPVFVEVLTIAVPVLSVSLVMGLAAKAGTEAAASITAASAIEISFFIIVVSFQ